MSPHSIRRTTEDADESRLEVCLLGLDGGDGPLQAYTFQLAAGLSIMTGGVSVVEVTEDYLRLALVQSDRSLATLQLDHAGLHPADTTDETEGCNATSGCKGLVVVGSDDGQMTSYRWMADGFQEGKLVHKFSFGLGTMGMGALKSLVGRPKEAADRLVTIKTRPTMDSS